MDVPRITVGEARERVAAGKALLVCAYDDPARCAPILLAGSLTMQEFRARRASLPREQEIVFYCS